MTELLFADPANGFPPSDASLPLTPGEAWPWRGMLRFHAETTRIMSTDLQSAVGVTLLEYDLLAHLHEQHDLCMVMNELADRVQITPSGITRMVDRLVARGLVERRPYSGDARRLLAMLTESGVALFERAQEFQNAAIRDRFLSHLSADELHTFAGVWKRLTSET
jgi:DNA-binding MarR family transcriptional regulator